VHTVGHSNLELSVFLAALREHEISQIWDVRSAPYSRFAPWANPKQLQAELERIGATYRYAGDQLGGRPTDPALRGPAGTPDYDKIAHSSPYREGIEALLEAAYAERIALLCSEADPLHCHRERLIGRTLRACGCSVKHILPDGSLLSTQQGTLL
jgi:uncharacterized protein (DUF488 family)